ncbi:hypothetical protein D3C84_1061050 [compost metagenome]
MIAGVVDHMHQYRPGAHDAAFTRDKAELDGLIQRGISLPFAPIAVPVIDVFLRLAQLGEFGVQQIV